MDGLQLKSGVKVEFGVEVEVEATMRIEHAADQLISGFCLTSFGDCTEVWQMPRFRVFMADATIPYAVCTDMLFTKQNVQSVGLMQWVSEAISRFQVHEFGVGRGRGNALEVQAC